MDVIKQLMPNIVEPFTHMCNKSFLDGCFPDKMKISKIVSVFKSCDKSSLHNCRPISVIPQLSNILQRLFESRLLNLNAKKNILSGNQYGFLWSILV